jgi:hypothetical protein
VNKDVNKLNMLHFEHTSGQMVESKADSDGTANPVMLNQKDNPLAPVTDTRCDAEYSRTVYKVKQGLKVRIIFQSEQGNNNETARNNYEV